MSCKTAKRKLVRAAVAVVGAWAFMIPSMVQAGELKEIMLAALKDGRAEGVVTGGTADRWKSMTRSDSVVYATVKELKKYKQPGCGRIEVTMKQENVPLRAGGVAPFAMTFSLNLCPDGLPPAEIGSMPGKGTDKAPLAPSYKGDANRRHQVGPLKAQETSTSDRSVAGVKP